MPISKIPLRARKYAQTKLAILKALEKRIRKTHIEDISIKEVCEELQISEGTFFNYFSKKSDILNYYITLWSIEVNYEVEKIDKNQPLKAIEKVFSYSFDITKDNPPMIFEIICYIAKQRKLLKIEDITVAEKLIAFPKLKGVEKIKAVSLMEIMRPYVKSAIKKKQLPKNTDVDLVLLNLRSIFFGGPLALTQTYLNKIKPIHQTQLKMLWTALNKESDINK